MTLGTGVIVFGALLASPSPKPTPPPSTPAAPAEPVDPAAENQKYMAELTSRITGKEGEPAEQVFKNVQMMKGMPAGRLLQVMQVGFSRSLGVGCTHCHVPTAFDSDEKLPKKATRGMMGLVRALNAELLPRIDGLSDKPSVNCTTCHRGQVKPALDIP